MKTNTAIVATLMILCNGCCSFPFLYPKTGAFGIVIDQHNDPVQNPQMQASWVRPSAFYHFMRPQTVSRFHADGSGKWSFYVRDAEHLIIEAKPPDGYESRGIEERSAGPLKSGECPTNACVLRLIKIQATEKPKDAK